MYKKQYFPAKVSLPSLGNYIVNELYQNRQNRNLLTVGTLCLLNQENSRQSTGPADTQRITAKILSVGKF